MIRAAIGRGVRPLHVYRAATLSAARLSACATAA